MKLTSAKWAAAALTVLMFSACEKAASIAPPPMPAEVTAEATGHYCGMLLADHEGPKGQIFLTSSADPIWFSSVRDTISFLRLPEEAKDVAAVFVNDMGKAKNWQQPEAGAWVDANNAWFVLESNMQGGMGAPEAVPFGEKPAAEAFVAEHGGKLAKLTEIPDAYVLGPVQLDTSMPHGAGDAISVPVEPIKPANGQPTLDTPDHREHTGH